MKFIIEGRLQKSDYYRYALKGVTLGRIIYLLATSSVMTWLIVPLLLDNPEGIHYVWMLVAIWIFFFILTVGQVWNDIRKSPFMFKEPQRITIDEEGLRRDVSCFYNTWKWSNVTSFKETREGLYFFLDAHVAVLLPKRFFKDKEEEQTVIQLVESKGTLRK